MPAKKNSKGITAEALFEAGAHFGHQSRRWNPKMEEYIWGEEKGVHIFDLEKTVKLLDEALKEITKLHKEGKKLIIVGTKKQAKDKVKDICGKSGINYVTERWLGGTITNFDQIQKSVKKLQDLKKDKESGVLNKYTKKERIGFDREIERLERFFSGLVGLESPPDMLFVIDVKKETGALREAKRREVVTFGLVDSNCDPDMVDYPIPMNDDSAKAIELLLTEVAKAYK